MAYLHGKIHEDGTDARKDVLRIHDGQVREPQRPGALKPRHRQVSHSARQLEHAYRQRDLEHGQEHAIGFDAVLLLDVFHLHAQLHELGGIAMGARHHELHEFLVDGLVDGVLAHFLRLVRFMLRDERWVGHDGADGEGGADDGAPPGQAGGDVQVLDDPLAEGGWPVAVIEAEVGEVAHVFWNVENGGRVEVGEGGEVGVGGELGGSGVCCGGGSCR